MELHLDAMGKRLASAKKKQVVEEGMRSFRNAQKTDRISAPASASRRKRPSSQ
jgi:hypothetical protein